MPRNRPPPSWPAPPALGDVTESFRSDRTVSLWEQRIRDLLAETADTRPGELVVVVDSYGMCSLALDRRSAATELRVRAGQAVTLLTPDASEATA